MCNLEKYFFIAVFQSGDCYEDSDGEILSFYAGDHADNTPSRCITLCEDYAYAGVQYGSHCFCGNTLPELILRRPEECLMACSGNADEICGDSWRMNIYGKLSLLQKIVRRRFFYQEPILL